MIIMPKLAYFIKESGLDSEKYIGGKVSSNVEGSALTFILLAFTYFIVIVFITYVGIRLYFVYKKYQTLVENNKRLSTHDSLTGLLNFDEFHRRLDMYLLQEKRLILIFVDCTDMKSLNSEQGVHVGNRILKQIADVLSDFFPDALGIARYGGDEFALLLRDYQGLELGKRMSDLFEKHLPQLIGIQLTYGTSVFPDDSSTKNELILAAEENMFDMKREVWLKREEHLLRSEKLRVVGELASGMAHEIRNPLTTVKGFLQLSKTNDYQIKPYYELIMDEITRMSELTAEFLQFSKPHATQFRKHSLLEVIKRVNNLMETEAMRLGHEIIVEADMKRPLYINMDQDKMVQLLLNLVKNAFEAMEEQGRTTIRLYEHKKNACLEIEDSGKGIASELIDKIFLPFYTSKDNGTGLGLSICHKIVQDHNGSIHVESTPGKGTKFKIQFPVVN
jgi:diguanylate cyclase (GGDEF)-like protein